MACIDSNHLDGKRFNIFIAMLKVVAPTTAIRLCCLFVYAPPRTDEEYVTGYGVQVIGFFDEYDGRDCLGTVSNIKPIESDTFPNKVRCA